MVYGCQILISIDIYDFYFFVFSSVFILIEKAYITLKTVFEHLFSWKTLRIFDSLLGVSKVVKHYLLCMIHHTNWGIFEKSKNFLSRAKNRNQKAWKALEDPRWPCWLHEKTVFCFSLIRSKLLSFLTVSFGYSNKKTPYDYCFVLFHSHKR